MATPLLTILILPQCANALLMERQRTARLVVEFDTEHIEQSRSPHRRQSERAASGVALEPCKLQQAIEDGGANQALEVIAAFGTVEARLAENSRPRARRQVGTEHAEELFPRARELAAFVGEY